MEGIPVAKSFPLARRAGPPDGPQQLLPVLARQQLRLKQLLALGASGRAAAMVPVCVGGRARHASVGRSIPPSRFNHVPYLEGALSVLELLPLAQVLLVLLLQLTLACLQLLRH